MERIILFAYANNTNAGTATVTVKGIGIFGGNKDVSYTITPVDISGYTLYLDETSFEYDGTAKTPAVQVITKVQAGVKYVLDAENYTVTYSDNTEAGTASVTVVGTGNYAGRLTATFTITEKKDSETEDKTEPGTEDKTEPGTEDKTEPGTEDKTEPGTDDKKPVTVKKRQRFRNWKMYLPALV